MARTLTILGLLTTTLGIRCSAPAAPPATCAAPPPIAYTTVRRYPLERSSTDSAEFHLVISGGTIVPAMAHICVLAGSAVVFRDSVPTVMWLPMADEINRDSVVRKYASGFFNGIGIFPDNPVPWGHGQPDPYGEFESDDPYSGLARGMADRDAGSRIDSAEIVAAVREFAERGSTMLAYQTDPEGGRTYVWWPSRRTFARLVL